MTDVAVLVPVLGRPERAEPLVRSLEASAESASLRPVFVLSPGDQAEVDAVAAAATARPPGAVGVVFASWDPGPGDYARKINLGYRATVEPWLFLGADDLCFCPGWADRALAAAGRSGARVVGTNDLGNARVRQGRHSTHSLVARSYADELGTVDGPGLVLCEAYDHNFCDDEMVWTARARSEFAAASDAWVEHLHPDWGKASRDATYDRGRSGFAADAALFRSRSARFSRGARAPLAGTWGR